MILIELVIVLAVVSIIVITVVAWWISGPPVGGTCRLIVRTLRPDYCGGGCPAGQACVATATRPYGWGGIFGVQAAGCSCARVVGVIGPGGVITTPSGQPIGTGIADPAGGDPR